MTYSACFVHVYHVRGCPDCQALRNSLYLSMVKRARAAVPTPDEQGELDKLKAGWKPTWEDRRAPTNAADELDRFVEKWCKGEVE